MATKYFVVRLTELFLVVNAGVAVFAGAVTDVSEPFLPLVKIFRLPVNWTKIGDRGHFQETSQLLKILCFSAPVCVPPGPPSSLYVRFPLASTSTMIVKWGFPDICSS